MGLSHWRSALSGDAVYFYACFLPLLGTDRVPLPATYNGGSALPSAAGYSFALSLFNAAELHRRDYALVQLMGMGRFSLAVIPLVDALVTSFVALGMAFACYAGVGTIIGLMFSETVGGSGLCRLHPEHVVLFCGSIILLAFFASLAASVKVLLISPSEIIHES